MRTLFQVTGRAGVLKPFAFNREAKFRKAKLLPNQRVFVLTSLLTLLLFIFLSFFGGLAPSPLPPPLPACTKKKPNMPHR